MLLDWVLDKEGTAKKVVSKHIIEKSKLLGCEPKDFRFFIKSNDNSGAFSCFIYDRNKPDVRKEITIGELLW